MRVVGLGVFKVVDGHPLSVTLTLTASRGFGFTDPGATGDSWRVLQTAIREACGKIAPDLAGKNAHSVEVFAQDSSANDPWIVGEVVL